MANKMMGVRDVLKEELCIGCGACTLGTKARIVFNSYGELVADVSSCDESEFHQMDSVCPFGSLSANETELAKQEFGACKDIVDGGEIGLYSALYAGYSKEFRESGSSGGVITWLLAHLLRESLVDKVIVVGRSNSGDRFFDFKVIGNVDDLKATGTSFYYPVSYDGVLEYVANNPGRYAITGVPCFHKALRQIKSQNKTIAERVVFQIGIVCGQLKSAFYLDYLDRKVSSERSLVDACFRRKNPVARADDYLFEGVYQATNGVGEKRSVRNREIGANWAMGLFKPKACDFCDDVYAETADISVMDAWLDKYVSDGRGTSLVVARSPAVREILDAGGRDGALAIESVDRAGVVESQRGGLNHRRVGLRYRLFVAAKTGLVPKKRVGASNGIDAWMKVEQRIRSEIRLKSRSAMKAQIDSKENGLDIYNARMRRMLIAYRWFLRVKSRLATRRDYTSQFRTDE